MENCTKLLIQKRILHTLFWMLAATPMSLLVLSPHAVWEWDIDPFRYILNEPRIDYEENYWDQWDEVHFDSVPTDPIVIVKPIGKGQEQSWLEKNRKLRKLSPFPMIPANWESKYEDKNIPKHFPHEEMRRTFPFSSPPMDEEK